MSAHADTCKCDIFFCFWHLVQFLHSDVYFLFSLFFLNLLVYCEMGKCSLSFFGGEEDGYG